MSKAPIGIIVNGATGRMGYHQHLVRSLMPIRDAGGVLLPDGSQRQIRLCLVGRRPDALRRISRDLGIEDWSTDLDAALAAPDWHVYFDAASTNMRAENLHKAIVAGKTIYTEKPVAASLEQSVEIATAAREAGLTTGVVHDKLFLPGFLKLRRLLDSAFFGDVLSVRGEFGYWVFEGHWMPSQRPSWNYKTDEGGGIVSDMFPHWCYVIENLFGAIKAVTAHVFTHIGERVDEKGEVYKATADDSAYALFELENGIVVQLNSSWDVRVNRDELVEFQVDGTDGSAVVGLWGAKIQAKEMTPRPTWNPDIPDTHDYLADWVEVPDNQEWQNAFKIQWEEFLRSVALGTTYGYDLTDGVRGVRLAEAALLSAREGRRVRLSELEK